jgi:hypothetical protein
LNTIIWNEEQKTNFKFFLFFQEIKKKKLIGYQKAKPKPKPKLYKKSRILFSLVFSKTNREFINPLPKSNEIHRQAPLFDDSSSLEMKELYCRATHY